MAKATESSEELTIGKQIEAEQRRIKPLFKGIAKERRRLVEKQIAQLAFLQVTLDRLVEAVNDSDILEDFCQGAQQFKRENQALRSYNATIKSYLAVSKQLCELLPSEDKQRAGEALLQFVATPPPRAKPQK